MSRRAAASSICGVSGTGAGTGSAAFISGDASKLSCSEHSSAVRSAIESGLRESRPTQRALGLPIVGAADPTSLFVFRTQKVKKNDE